MILPSPSAASSMRWSWPRPWWVENALRTVSVQDGQAELVGQGDGQHLVGVDVELCAEAAAHRGSDDPELALGDAGGGGDHHLEDVRDLGGAVERDLAAVR